MKLRTPRAVSQRTRDTYRSVKRSKPRLKPPKNQSSCLPKGPPCAACSPLWTGLSSVAHSAGDRLIATSTDSTIALTTVIENWR